MRAKRKTDYHHGRLRQALIEAAVKTIAQRGVDALSLRELAARAGVSPGAPYHHFPNRSDLLASIAEEGFRRLEAEWSAARDAAPKNASARLEALGLAYVTFAVSSLGYFRLMFHGASTSTGPTEAGLRTFNILRDAVVACQQAGQAPKGDATGLVLVAWSAVHGFATLWVDRALPFQGLEPEQLAPEIGRLVSRMFSALAACPAWPRERSRRKRAARLKSPRHSRRRRRGTPRREAEGEGGCDGRECLQSGRTGGHKHGILGEGRRGCRRARIEEPEGPSRGRGRRAVSGDRKGQGRSLSHQAQSLLQVRRQRLTSSATASVPGAGL